MKNRIEGVETSLRYHSLIFQDETVFDPKYQPKTIFHREKELTILSQLFMPLITKPNCLSRKILITGLPHTGKTKTIKVFVKMLACAGKKRGVKFYTPYINCSIHNTHRKLLAELDAQLPSFRKRIMARLRDLSCHPNTYRKRAPHFVIILDAIEIFREDWAKLIMSIASRLLYKKDDTRVSYIAIVSNEFALDYLPWNPPLPKDTLRFEPFTCTQLFDILSHRASLGFKPGVIFDDHIEMVTRHVIKHGLYGSVNYGLKILRYAGKYAQKNRQNFIKYSDIRKAIISINAMWI